jgi:hypothetical protein
MKIASLLLAVGAATAAAPVLAQPSVGVSIGINQPGVYGRINIGDVPPPVLINPQPIVVAPTPVAAQRRPIYMYVPPAYQRDWRHYCGRYDACGQPVYFVKEDWVRDRYREAHAHDRDRRDWDRRERHDDHRDDRHDDRRHH